MKSWEEAEERVRYLTGGWITPGSGSKNVRGDIVTKSYRFEVKYTDNPDYINLQYSWFKTLEHLHETTDLESVLVVFIQRLPIVFVLDGLNNTVIKKWSSTKLKATEVPSEILTSKYTWKTYDLDYLTQL